MQVINFFNDQTVPLSDDVEELIVSACKSVLSIENFSDDAEISVTLVDADEIRALNRDFRNIDRATDVLSFPLGENGEYETSPSDKEEHGTIVVMHISDEESEFLSTSKIRAILEKYCSFCAPISFCASSSSVIPLFAICSLKAFSFIAHAPLKSPIVS